MKKHLALLLCIVMFTSCSLGTTGGFATIKPATQPQTVTVPKPVTPPKPVETPKPVVLDKNALASKSIDLLLTEMQKMGTFSGSVIMAHKNKILLNKGYGFSNEEFDVLNQPKTMFRIASLTKQVTAVAVLRLEDQGKLSIKDPLSKFIPEYPRGSEITLEMLLNHTSGLGDSIKHTKMSMEAIQKLKRTPDQLVKMIMPQPLKYEPGTTYFYSNHGYILLGYCIEKASGMTYGDYLKKEIFEPLKIQNLYYETGETLVKNRAEGYKVVNGSKVKSDWFEMSNAYAAGGLIGTTESYLKWQQNYNNSTLLSSDAWNRFFNTTVKTNRTPLIDESYGLGIMQTTTLMTNGQPTRVIYHTGGVNGFRTFQLKIEALNLDLVMMSNNESIDLDMLLFQALGILMKAL